jgi:hypothetical protein
MGKRRLSVTQVLVLGVVVVLVVFAGTYISIRIGGGGAVQPKVLQPPPAAPAQLTFAEKKWPDDPANPDATAVWERHKKGHHNFWFDGTGDAPVEVWLNTKNCKCTDVEIGLLPEEMRNAGKDERERVAAKDGLEWHSIKLNETKGFTVPPHRAGGVRLTWDSEKEDKQTLVAELRTKSGEVTGEPVSLRLGLDMVPAFLVTPEDNMREGPHTADVSLGTIGAGDSRTVNLIAWSCTRDQFGLNVQPPEDPCVRCGKPMPLDTDECKKLATQAQKPVLSAYRVPVTVSERTEDGTQFDMGRFRRLVKFTGDPGTDLFTVTLIGTVQGEVTIGSAEDRGVIDLKSFERHNGISQSISLTAADGKLELEVENCPDFMKAELEEVKPGPQATGLLGKTWTLKVTVPPDALAGAVPPHTSVVLKTKGDRPRRIHIPVIGIAYVRLTRP